MVKRQFFTSGEWVIVVGLLCFVMILLSALFSDSFKGPPPAVQVSPAPVPVVQVPQTVADAVAVRMIPVATVQPTPRAQGTVKGSGVVAMAQIPQVNFKGTVQQITEQPQSDGELHIWVTTANGLEKEVSVAPGWFLQYLGCTLQHDITVSGAGFVFSQGTGNDLVYAKKIVINGKACQLRNDEGFALWSNKLR